MGKDTSIYEHYKTEIYRIGWRLQYRAKKIRSRECSIDDHNPSTPDFTVVSDEKLIVQQLFATLTPQERSLLIKIYFQNLSEAEIAKQYHISQQAVNKWKRKMIQKLSQTMR
jgi:RNA polymerase sigma factor (sigma-70 family)